MVKKKEEDKLRLAIILGISGFVLGLVLQPTNGTIFSQISNLGIATIYGFTGFFGGLWIEN